MNHPPLKLVEMDTKRIISNKQMFNNFLYPIGKAGKWYLAVDNWFDYIYVFSEQGEVIKNKTPSHRLVVYLDRPGFIEVNTEIPSREFITIVKLENDTGIIDFGEFDWHPDGAYSTTTIVVYSDYSCRNVYYLYGGADIVQINLKEDTTQIFDRMHPMSSPRLTSRQDILAINSLRFERRRPPYVSFKITPIECLKTGKIYNLTIQRSYYKDGSGTVYVLLFDTYWYLGEFKLKHPRIFNWIPLSTNFAIYGRYLYVYCMNFLYVIDLTTIRKPLRETCLDDPDLFSKLATNQTKSNITTFDLQKYSKMIDMEISIAFTPKKILIGGFGITSMEYFDYSPEKLEYMPSKFISEARAFLDVIQKVAPALPREICHHIIRMIA